MTATGQVPSAIAEAIEKIEAYVLQTTGAPPTTEELASALKRYFVMKEIADFITMSRTETAGDRA